MDPSLASPHPEPSSSPAEFVEARTHLARSIAVQTQISDPRLFRAFSRVPRHRFLPEGLWERAYDDAALPLGHGQTISQPSMIAIMLHALDLRPTDRVLEVGSGSGYAAALLAELTQVVYAVEILPDLARESRQRLAELKIENVTVFEGNGRLGLPAHAPYDKILVSAGSEDVPPELIAQLAPGGILAIPVGADFEQRLLIGRKDERGSMHWQPSISCLFVPLVSPANR